MGRQTSVTDAEGGVTKVSYDAFGQVSSRTDAEGTVVSYTYTPGKRQLATTTVDEFTGGEAPETNMVVESRAYDPMGRVAAVADAMGNVTRYLYYSDGLLWGEYLDNYVDPDSGETRSVLVASYAYTGDGSVSTATRGEGRYKTTISYDPGGRAIATADWDGDTLLRSTRTGFDVLDNPVDVIEFSASNEVKARSQFVYDALGRETTRVDYLTSTVAARTTTVRDERGLPVRVVAPGGYEPDATPAEHATDITYDALGQQVSIATPPVEVERGGEAPATERPETSFGYDAFGSLTHRRDAAGGVAVSDHDAVGRETSTRLPDYSKPGTSTPLSAVLERDYDGLGRVVASRDGTGAETRFSYDEFGNLVERQDPAPDESTAGATTTIAYTPTGLARKVTDPTGATTYATYDEAGRRITSTVTERNSAQTLTSEYRYDVLDNLETVTSPTGLVTTFENNDLGDPVKLVDPAGVQTRVSYDSMGRPTRVEEPGASVLEYSYDLGSRTTEIRDIDPAGAVLRTRSFDYDRDGNQTLATDGTGATVKRSYDALGQLRTVTESVTDTKSIVTSFGYDARGNVSRVTDGNGNATVHTTNAWGLPESVIEPATAQTPDAGDRTYTTSYDVAGRPETVIQPGGVRIDRSYDGAGRLVAETGLGAEAATADRAFSYDAAGRVLTATAGGATNTYSYNDRGQLTSASGVSGETTNVFDEEGRLTSAQTAAGTTTFGYDPQSGRLATIHDPLTQASVSYGYDALGRVSQASAGATSRDFAYDDFGRIVADALTVDGQTTAAIEYGYDLADRVTSKQVTGLAGAAGNTYSYDQAGRLTEWARGSNVVGYEWDDADNLISRDGVAATYNERNQLLTRGDTTYTYSPRGTLRQKETAGEVVASQFDAFGQLTQSGETANTYDAFGRLITSGGATLAYLGAGLEVTFDGERHYTYGRDGDVLGIGGTGLEPTQGASLGWSDLHTDLVAGLDPATGEVTGSRSYDPFGEVLATGGQQPALGYQHQFTDPVSGEVNMGARWYAPESATFTSRDRAALDPADLGNANRYAYASGNPLTHIDPLGYWSIKKAWKKTKSAVKKVAKATVSVAKEVSGYNDLKGCVGGSMSSCAWFVAGFTPVGKIAKGIKVGVKAGSKALKSTRAGKAVGSSRAGRAVSSAASRTGKAVRRVSDAGVQRLGRAGHLAARAGTAAGRGLVRSTGRFGAAAVSSGAAAVARAAAAREAARVAAQRAAVQMRTRVPAAKPPASPSISPSVQKQLDAANSQPAIDLGVMKVGHTGDDAAQAAIEAAAKTVDDAATVKPGYSNPASPPPSTGPPGSPAADLGDSTGGPGLLRSGGDDVGQAGSAANAEMDSFLASGATVRHSSTATAIGDDARTITNFERSVGVGGRHDVIVHGTMDGRPVVNGNVTHTQQIADAILENPGYVPGCSIRLVMCHGGREAASQLSQILGADVLATTRKAQLSPLTGQLLQGGF